MHQYTIFDEDDELNLGAPVEAPEDIQNAWRKAKQTMKRNFTELQEMDYFDKLERQEGIEPYYTIVDPGTGEGLLAGTPTTICPVNKEEEDG